MNQVIVPRVSADETTFAIVRWTGPKKLLHPLRAALTEWAKTTDEGREEWENSSSDFNVSDLSNACYEDEPLKGILAKHGITDLQVEVYSDSDYPGNWTYDTVLVDE